MSSIWDELDKEASVDNRIGNHDFLVDAAAAGQWPSGEVYYELEGRLTTANNFNLRQRFTVAPTEDEVREHKAEWDQSRKRGAILAHNNAKVLADEYKTSLGKIQPGQTYRVKTDYQTKDGKKYIRIVNFLPKTAALSPNGSTGDAPF